MTLSDYSEIFDDMKHRAVSLRQLSFLFTLRVNNNGSADNCQCSDAVCCNEGSRRMFEHM